MDGEPDGRLLAAWRDLAEAADTANVFAGPEMFLAARGRIAPADWVPVPVEGPGGRLDAIAAVRRTRTAPVLGPRVVDLYWSHYGPRGCPLIRAGVPDAADRLLEALAAHGPVVRQPYAALCTGAVRALVGAAERRGGAAIVVDEHERARLDVAAGAAALGPGLVGRRRRELDRQWRKLAEGGPLSTWTSTGHAALAGLDAFVALEHKGWKGRVRTSLASDRRRVDFARAFLEPLATADRVRVDRLDRAGEPIAVLITLFSGDTGFLWKIAYDERFAHGSPGVQLVRRASEALLDRPGLAGVDSLAVADHSLMDRSWAGRMRIGTLFLALGPAALPAARRAAAAETAVIALRARARTIRGLVRQTLRRAPGP